MVSIYTKKQSTKYREAFSLIELLVVIAIIALLAAIIFPVFASVRENGRQSSAISNMHDISAKMEMYKLDTGHYPPVLFGYAVPQDQSNPTGAKVHMDKALDKCTADKNCDTYLAGLYPAYINNIAVFKDPNNDVDYAQTADVGTFTLCSENNQDTNCQALPSNSRDGVLVISKPVHTFYKADAYDISPKLDGANSINTNTYLPRYQTSWTMIPDCTSTTPPALCSDPKYLNQLRWKNPPAGTYVTSDTYHVKQSGKVLVLTQNGNVTKIDAAAFNAKDTTSIPDVDPTTGVANVDYWTITK